MSGCSHGHSKKPDIATIVAGFGESITSYISNAYWLAQYFDLISGLDDDFLTISWPVLTFGLVGSTALSAGAVYAHVILNMHHQKLGSSKDEEAAPLIYDDDNGTKLKWYQKLALVMDFCTHTGDAAGPITFVFELCTRDKDIPRWGQLITQCSATLFGGVVSLASVRTCMNSMRESNRERSCL